MIMVAAPLGAANMQGTVYDGESGETLSAASIYLVGTGTGASSDLDGNYVIDDVKPGTYDIRASAAGYSSKVLPGVEVNGKGTVSLDISLSRIGADLSQAYILEDLVVTAERILSTGAALLAERKRAATIGDAISAEQISRSPDATSGDALKRVTGLSVMDNKFVFIRGVTDRYNETALNGVAVSGTDTDVDKKSFSFDLIPANLLANTVVVKTATPDLPGSFTGGLVKVNTLEFPPDRVIKFGHSQSTDISTTAMSFLRSHSGDSDWLGEDDGIRGIPTDSLGQRLTGNELAAALPQTWVPRTKKAPFNKSFNFALGDHYFLGTHELGMIGALSYKSGYSNSRLIKQSSMPFYDYEGAKYTYNVLWGGILNLNYRPSAFHKFSLESTLSQAASDRVEVSEGVDEISSVGTSRQTIEWDQRSLLVTQLSGEHTISFLTDLELEWKAYQSGSEAEEPDRKNVVYQMDPWGRWVMIENYRSWSFLNENSWGLAADLSVPLPWDTKFKMGWQKDVRSRDFEILVYHTDQSKLQYPYYGLVVLPLDEIFLPENYGPKKFQFLLYGDFTGEYDGRHDIDAYYGMVDVPIRLLGQSLRLVGGARVEESDQTVTGDTADPTNPFSEAEIQTADVLPSANLTYRMGENVNLRLAASRSVNRPEFREMANLKYFDFDEFQNVIGNPDLTRAIIRNYDIRFEMFPQLGEVLAVSYFYKDLQDAIEIKLIPEPTRWVRTWFNSPEGKNYGWEVELRKSLGFLGGPLSGLTITTNYTRVQSEVKYVDKKTNSQGEHIIRTLTRPLQGQSPWMVNVNLLYNMPEMGTTVSLLYNKIGRRLDSVGDKRQEDVYEEPRAVYDLAITQRLPANLRLKLTAKDLLADDQVYTMGPEYAKAPHSREKESTSYSLSLSLKL
jgi:outer membrane receptor protein involved in Fe transport